jgi:citrate synthase
MARESGLAGKGIAFMEALEQRLRESVKPLPINIDGALAAVLYDLGFPAAFGKLVFIIGRVAGLTAEVAEEYAREKAMRIRIPVTYDGEPPREIE